MTNLEKKVERIIRSIGYNEKSKEKLLIKNAPYKTIYGGKGRTEFVLVGSKSIRIECKEQFNVGSADEKLPYFLQNTVNFPEDIIIFVYEGLGFRRGSIEWLKKSSMTTEKNLKILEYQEFKEFFQEIIN